MCVANTVCDLKFCAECVALLADTDGNRLLSIPNNV